MLEMSIKRKPSNKSKRRDKKDNADYMNFHRCNRLNENIVVTYFNYHLIEYEHGNHYNIMLRL